MGESLIKEFENGLIFLVEAVLQTSAFKEKTEKKKKQEIYFRKALFYET